MSTRTSQNNASGDPKSSSATAAGSEPSGIPTGTLGLITIPATCHNDPEIARPALCTSFDASGQDGMRERLKRRRRLTRSIRPNPEQPRDILQTFETAVIAESIAPRILSDALSNSLYYQFEGVCSEMGSFVEGHRVFELEWEGTEPTMSNATLPVTQFTPSSEGASAYQLGIGQIRQYTLVALDALSLTLGNTFSFGTAACIGTLENIGPKRYVIATAGHVVDDAPSLDIQGDS
ncbi:hypothetical protein AJ80_02328 [Polytolypa hystricis UAMH7299]|uniref:Uncharacterized protein n=1 Tax=Polytolypa hystricis (strain UAMH7299) TaxID=1447883 RepID=A0A2B7YRP3_POLH7|nr:hypothetical protein AJ80_02328 [Polytolypa hystricis UAMH7299]